MIRFCDHEPALSISTRVLRRRCGEARILRGRARTQTIPRFRARDTHGRAHHAYPSRCCATTRVKSCSSRLHSGKPSSRNRVETLSRRQTVLPIHPLGLVHSLSQRLMARYFSVLLITSGVVSAIVHPLPNLTDMSGNERMMITVACVVGGMIIWVLPWDRWPRSVHHSRSDSREIYVKIYFQRS